MTVENTRIENARQLAEEVGGGTRFGERVGITRQLVSNYIGKRPVKNIGIDIARKIEQSFSRPAGWLDEDHTARYSAGSAGPWGRGPPVLA